MSQARLPYNMDAEQQVLGAILARDDIFHDLPEDLSASDFYDPRHNAIFQVCATLIGSSRRANIAIVSDYLSQDHKVSVSEDYLERLADAVIDVHDAPSYGRQVSELAYRRRSIIAMQDGISELLRLDPNENAISRISEIEAKVLAASRYDGQTSRRLGEWAQLSAYRIQNTIQNLDPSASGMTWGLTSVDQVIGPAMPGDLIVLGGRSGMGKSALAGQTAVAQAIECQRITKATGKAACIGVVSLEMKGEMWSDRALATRTSIAAWRITRGKLTEDDLDKIVTEAHDLRSVPLYIDQKTRVNMDQIRAKALRWKHQYGLRGLYIDHLGLIRAIKGRADKLELYDDICQDLKSLAKELGIFIVLLSQVNSEGRKRDNDRPRASDLMYYSSIEPHADIIFFAYRPYLAHMDKKPDPKMVEKTADWELKGHSLESQAEIINAKSRSGKGFGSCACRWVGPIMRFEDLQTQGMELAQADMELY